LINAITEAAVEIAVVLYGYLSVLIELAVVAPVV
jgi:hypothetical protein